MTLITDFYVPDNRCRAKPSGNCKLQARVISGMSSYIETRVKMSVCIRLVANGLASAFLVNQTSDLLLTITSVQIPCPTFPCRFSFHCSIFFPLFLGGASDATRSYADMRRSTLPTAISHTSKYIPINSPLSQLGWIAFFSVTHYLWSGRFFSFSDQP